MFIHLKDGQAQVKTVKCTVYQPFYHPQTERSEEIQRKCRCRAAEFHKQLGCKPDVVPAVAENAS